MPPTDSSDPALRIPVNDAGAALSFCRALSEALSGVSPLSTRTPAREDPEISVVVPVCNEEENLRALYAGINQALAGQCQSHEIIFVNDGSRDGSGALLEALAKDDSRVGVLELARNFGQQAAISAGLDFCRGRGVIVMDADLQDSPEVLPRFIAKWRSGCEVVYAVRTGRKERWLLRQCYRVFYRLLKLTAAVEIPPDAGDFCIMDRRVVDLLRGMRERNRFVRGIRSWVGFTQAGIAVERQARRAGAPKYNLAALIGLALDGFFSFSFVPLRLISLTGAAVSVLSLCLAVFYAVKKVFWGLRPPGFATLVVMVSFFAGVQLLTAGLMGEYLGRIFEEVKQRPLYTVRAYKAPRRA